MRRIAFYGSSILSSYWNGAATYYRGLVRALAGRGYDITFYEPRAFDRQDNADIGPPSWCKVVVYPADIHGVRAAAECAAGADIVIKASGVGVFDDELLLQTMRAAKREALRIWWDVDAPATLAALAAAPDSPLCQMLADIDAVFTYGGGERVVAAYRGLGARECEIIYNGVDPDISHPVAPDPRFKGDLGFLGNRLPDREQRVEQFFLQPAREAQAMRFLLGGSGWDSAVLPGNVLRLGHVGTTDNNAFNSTVRAVLNINRQSMAEYGFAPPTRVFEAAGAGACTITDSWAGIEVFLTPGEEILVARDGKDVLEMLVGLDEKAAKDIGMRARRRMLSEHTYDKRAQTADSLFRKLFAAKSMAIPS